MKEEYARGIQGIKGAEKEIQETIVETTERIKREIWWSEERREERGSKDARDGGIRNIRRKRQR